ncbi:Uu.00g033900.m01.CDS01 [Anthostomella pinea]|uniref:Uu.00g033900.m01.CDS01 n=1 Tax=Anthostomella pinea TaxID=933095 RepID=A0AAI8YDB2_9PEZI|nr:Uu.00g033900.m01.CDS01 [Anthostomella pinea]
MQFLVTSLLLASVATASPSFKVTKRQAAPAFDSKLTAYCIPEAEDSHMPNVTAVAVTANTIIPVVVGGAQDTFVPNLVTAAVGDVIQFQFSNGNHTVTQSSADAPCTPLQAMVATAIHSGHIPFEDGQTTVGTFSMPVTSADTMFLYCATVPHCQEGQVMQILDYAAASAASGASVDGTNVVGGTVASIPLEAAAFMPAPAEAAAPPPAADPAAADPAVADPAATGTTTVIVTVTPTAAAVASAIPTLK